MPVEKSDFSSGASSNTPKWVNGFPPRGNTSFCEISFFEKVL
jgi:hypothetical protein